MKVLDVTIEVAAIKVSALTWVGTVVTATDASFNNITLPIWSVPLTVLASSAVGALVAFAHFDEPNRKKLFGMALANTFLAASLVTILPLWLEWEWMTPEVKKVAQAPLGFVLAFAMRWAVPLLTEVGPTWVRNKFGKNGATP